MQTLKHLKFNKYLTLRQNSKTSWERPVAHEHYFLPLLTKNWHQKDVPYKKEQKKMFILAFAVKMNYLIYEFITFVLKFLQKAWTQNNFCNHAFHFVHKSNIQKDVVYKSF